MVVFCAPCSGPDPSALGNLIFVTWEGLLAMVVLVSGLRAVRSGRWAAIRMTVAWWVLGLVPAVFIVAPMIENVRKVIQIMTCPLRA
jgi:hypothetical protein